MAVAAPFMARARTDARDWLIEADEPLAGLQLRSGGELPGIIASPALLEMVRRARVRGTRLSRSIRARDDHEQVTAWVEVVPETEGKGCLIGVSSWESEPLTVDTAEDDARRAGIARHLAELSARLGPRQDIVSVQVSAPELQGLAARIRQALGTPWTDFVVLEGNAHRQPLHWRLLNGARLRLEESTRQWKAHLVPLGQEGSAGFELYLVADEPAEGEDKTPPPSNGSGAAIGRDIAPVLRQPITRIVANAETIRSQLAGPLSDEYANYAADIAGAGEHLLALLDDLTDLETIEDVQFTTAAEPIDLADLARRAAGILAGRARERGIRIETPKSGQTALAVGEVRRVLQILLNLLGNAIRYSPEGSRVSLQTECYGDETCLAVIDEGDGLERDQQARIFNKFERLGRSGDGGSGLGLYISRRLARAMNGDLTVESAPGQGARFTLALPAA